MGEWQTVLEAVGGGAGALIIIGLAWAYREERKERREAQKESRETLLMVLPAVAALKDAADSIERNAR
jgi:glucose uptake protein GlcU